MEKSHRNKLLNNLKSRNYRKRLNNNCFIFFDLTEKKKKNLCMPTASSYHEDCRQEKVKNKGCLYKLMCSSSSGLIKYT